MSAIPAILTRTKDAGHSVFLRGAWNLNIIGVRSAGREANKFDDLLRVVFKDSSGAWVDLSFGCTTDPGTYYRLEPPLVQGTAILAAGQYRSAYQIGLHQGRYEALVQRAPVTVYRDDNRDERLDFDPDTREDGWFGINIHRAGSDSTVVNRWSAGCQVIANAAEFDIFMSIVKKSAALYGNSFTYTLLED